MAGRNAEDTFEEVGAHGRHEKMDFRVFICPAEDLAPNAGYEHLPNTKRANLEMVCEPIPRGPRVHVLESLPRSSVADREEGVAPVRAGRGHRNIRLAVCVEKRLDR